MSLRWTAAKLTVASSPDATVVGVAATVSLAAPAGSVAATAVNATIVGVAATTALAAPAGAVVLGDIRHGSNIAMRDKSAAIVSVGAVGSWYEFSIREHGNGVYDPADPDPARRYKLFWTGQNFSGSIETGCGMHTSPDGVTWTNRTVAQSLFGTGVNARVEDPYCAVDATTGYAYRDGTNQLLVYVEDKTSGGQRDIDLWRSADHGVTWVRTDRVLDKGTLGAWDADDRTSPAVVWDGTRFVMVWEGRSPTNTGEIGFATSADGVAWTVGNGGAQIVTRKGGYTDGIVSDELYRDTVNGRWIMLAHGRPLGGTFDNMYRFATNQMDPTLWTESAWYEMPGNPYDTTAATHCLIGYDPGFLVVDRAARDALFTSRIQPLNTVSPSLFAPSATVAVAAPAGAVSGGVNATVLGPVATSALVALAGVVDARRLATVLGPVAMVTLAAPAGAVSIVGPTSPGTIREVAVSGSSIREVVVTGASIREVSL